MPDALPLPSERRALNRQVSPDSTEPARHFGPRNRKPVPFVRLRDRFGSATGWDECAIPNADTDPILELAEHPARGVRRTRTTARFVPTSTIESMSMPALCTRSARPPVEAIRNPRRHWRFNDGSLSAPPSVSVENSGSRTVVPPVPGGRTGCCMDRVLRAKWDRLRVCLRGGRRSAPSASSARPHCRAPCPAQSRTVFSRLCRAHSNWMFSVKREVPPFENGRMWSKCKLSVSPHRTQRAPSRA